MMHAAGTDRFVATAALALLLVSSASCSHERRNDLISQEALRHQLATGNYTANELKRRQDETTKHARQMAKEYRKARKRLTQAKRDFTLQAANEQVLATRIGALKKRNAALAAQNTQLAAQNKQLAEQHKKLEAAAKVLRGRLAGTDAAHQQLSAKVTAQQGQVTKLKQELARITAQARSLETQTADKLPRTELLRKLAAREAELARLKTLHQQLLKELETIRRSSKQSPSNN